MNDIDNIRFSSENDKLISKMMIVHAKKSRKKMEKDLKKIINMYKGMTKRAAYDLCVKGYMRGYYECLQFVEYLEAKAISEKEKTENAATDGAAVPASDSGDNTAASGVDEVGDKS